MFLFDKDREVTKTLVHSHPNNLVHNLTGTLAEHPMTIGFGSQKKFGAQENTSFFADVVDVRLGDDFNKIKVSSQIAKNEIDFWGRQVSEHALFAYLGLEDPDLKAKALSLHKELEKFRAAFNKNSDDMQHMNKILPLLKRLRELQIEALKAAKAGRWLGWLFPSYFNHVTLELDCFLDKLNGAQYSPKEEVDFSIE